MIQNVGTQLSLLTNWDLVARASRYENMTFAYAMLS